MTLYLVFKVSDTDDLLKKMPKKEVAIEHPKIADLKIRGTPDSVYGSGTQNVLSILSTPDNPFEDQIKIHFTIKHHKISYCLVELSGRGLLTVHGYPKYVRELIIEYIEKFLKIKYSLNVSFETSYKYSNEHFNTTFWGKKVICELAFVKSENMFIKISSPNFLKIINSNPNLKEYFQKGTIRFLRGEIDDLAYKKNNTYQKGLVKFDNSGVFRCDFTDIDFFNEYVEKLIDKGFFGGVSL
jgi:hypothetical protein